MIQPDCTVVQIASGCVRTRGARSTVRALRAARQSQTGALASWRQPGCDGGRRGVARSVQQPRPDGFRGGPLVARDRRVDVQPDDGLFEERRCRSLGEDGVHGRGRVDAVPEQELVG